MKSRWASLLVLVGALGCGGGAQGNGAGEGPLDGGGADGLSPAGEGALSPAERDALLQMREEEKLARDVYAALDHYGNPFVNVQTSEQRHMDAMLELLDSYDLADPAADKGVGAFTSGELQALHDELVAQGSPTSRDAYSVGCAIEELDLHDLEVAKAQTTHADIAATYDLLMLGSRNHLRAFYGRLTSAGGSYTPRYLDQAAFDAIIQSPKERPSMGR